MERRETRLLTLTGRVQGVGFRPFVYRLALRLGLDGWVRNRGGEVAVLASGPASVLNAFRRALVEQAPPLARPRLLAEASAEAPATGGFVILESRADVPPRAHVPPDQSCCDACLAELREPLDRRFAYPFINCTQCGPRYTLIHDLPYDRPNTSMAGFPLCPACAAEYADPADRRFHAEPVACPECGPSLRFRSVDAEFTGNAPALAACLAALRAGAIVAVKGVGGYHLLCDARDGTAVRTLRIRKPRPDKPLAVMFPQHGDDALEAVRQELAPEPAEAAWLAAPERPVVLCARSTACTLAAEIAPGLDTIGAMLPYSPLHHLLLDGFGGPLVATSGNLGGEPVICEASEAEAKLTRVADAFLHHDRPILRPADDAVYRVIADIPRPLRLGRGVAPLELDLPGELPRPTLAVGGHMKNTVALGWGRRAVVSPHIGDLASRRGREVFAEVIATLQGLYGIRAEQVVCDAHPDYASSRWALRSGLPVERVFHHHAHAAALYAEHNGAGPWLVFTWDGVGYGEDGTAWGGETLLGEAGRWRRVARLRPFRLPGGDRAGREPWRAAAALCWETGREAPHLPTGATLAHEAWARGLNSPLSSAAGRLFDGAAALLGLVRVASFEGQGPMQLEAVADLPTDAAPLPLAEREGLLEIDWRPLLPELLDDALAPAARAGRFHARLAASIAAVARRLAGDHAFTAVGLTGGVFQNRLLSETATRNLAAEGFETRLASAVPANDGGLSFGQLAALIEPPG